MPPVPPPGPPVLARSAAPPPPPPPAPPTTFPPIAADCSTSGGPRPCWPFCKPHDPGLASSQLRRYWLARALTEPLHGVDRTVRDLAVAVLGLYGLAAGAFPTPLGPRRFASLAIGVFTVW